MSGLDGYSGMYGGGMPGMMGGYGMGGSESHSIEVMERYRTVLM